MGFLHRNKPEISSAGEEESANQTRLMKLVGNDQKLYAAMSNFLLLDPERQVSQHGDVNYFTSRGDAAKSSGDNLVACVNYEVAARIALYRQDKDGVARSMLLADEAIAKDTHKTILANIDEALRIAEEYHGIVKSRKLVTSDSPAPITVTPLAV